MPERVGHISPIERVGTDPQPLMAVLGRFVISEKTDSLGVGPVGQSLLGDHGVAQLSKPRDPHHDVITRA